VSNERLNELAAAFSSGEITPAERAELLAKLAVALPTEKKEAAEIIDTAALLSSSIAPEVPSPALKTKIFERIQKTNQAASAPLTFLSQAAESDWQPMKVPGAYVKLLSLNRERGYAVALGKLDRNTSYPAHVHKGAEDVLVLTGDLSIGQTRLEAGDFHHAEAGSRHDINHSENGCTILIVLTTEDLMAQMT
jgi:anti-sigma factor ChrR (cupin superfamily)